MNTQDRYQKAIIYAAGKHNEGNQTVKGTDLPYVVHVCNVAMEILAADPHTDDWDLNLAVETALLHDVIEDTSATKEDVISEFGKETADAVMALTKNEQLPKADRMKDSLARIKSLSKEVWSVKIADRITNLQKPPKTWDQEKKQEYYEQSLLIYEELKGANSYLENRLKDKIEAYKAYIFE